MVGHCKHLPLGNGRDGGKLILRCPVYMCVCERYFDVPLVCSFPKSALLSAVGYTPVFCPQSCVSELGLLIIMMRRWEDSVDYATAQKR